MTATWKSAGCMIWSVTVQVRLAPPLRPVTVAVYVPGGVDAEVEKVSVEVVLVEPAANEAVAGLNDAVVPAGSPLTLSATGSAKPYSPETVTVEVAVDPCGALAELALRAKSWTTSPKAALRVLPPPVPEITTVS